MKPQSHLDIPLGRSWKLWFLFGGLTDKQGWELHQLTPTNTWRDLWRIVNATETSAD